MDTAPPQKFPFILDINLAKANCTGNYVCTSCDKVVLVTDHYDEEKEKEQDANWSFIVLAAQRVTGSLVYICT